MTSNSFATLTKALGLGKSRKQTRPPMLRTSVSHSSLFSPSTEDLSGSPPPRSAPPTQSSLRHSKSASNFLTLGRNWTRRQRNLTADHIFLPPAATTASSAKAPHKFTLARRSTASTTSSNRTTSTHYTTSHTANESLPHASLPAPIWPRFAWDPSEEIDLELNDEDDHDDEPVFADFFQRLRNMEAELDLIEARGRLQK